MPDKIDRMNKPAPTQKDDWLWYYPDPDPGYDRYDYSFGDRAFQCYKCDVTWRQLVEKKTPIRCFACGRFMRKPKI